MSSWTKPLSLTDALHQLDDTASVHRLYNALVVIRTNYSKGGEAVSTLRHRGGVEKLLCVLSKTADSKCRDAALSILGNCCTDEKCRLKVLKSDNGIGTICSIICDSEKESIRNRGCRVLANLCQTIACCDIIHEDHAEVFSMVVSDLCKTTITDCKVTYCRLIRMLSDTVEHREAMLSHSALKSVATLLRADDATLLLSAVKTVACFVNNCSEEATRQLVSEAALESLVALTSRTDSSDVVSAASILLLSVASNAPSLRPYLGRSGAVEYFIRCLKEVATSERTLPHKFSTVDALCHCCRDANNRIKIREEGGLSVLTDLLSNSQLASIHQRIISALVCFIYDDASITILLQNRLIPTLISHLYRLAGIDYESGFLGLDSSFDVCESLKMDLIEMADNSLERFDNASVCCNDLKSADEELTGFSAETEFNQSDLLNSSLGFSIETDNPDAAAAEEPLSAADTTLLESDKSDVVNNKGTQEFDLLSTFDEPTVSEANAGEICVKTSRYSINSPTYKAVSAWRMEMTADEDEDDAHDRHSPRNIWEGARHYAENLPAHLPSRSGSVSPARSPSSRSEGLRNVQSWSSSLCDVTPRTSPSVSPAWSLDSSGSGIYSPFSNSSYIYPDGACSPSSHCGSDDCQPVSLSRCDFANNQLQSAPEIGVRDNQHVVCSLLSQTHSLSERESAVEESQSESTANVRIHQNTVDIGSTGSPALAAVMLDNGQQKDTVGGSSSEFSARVDEADGKQPVTLFVAERDLEEHYSDEEFDIESFRRKRHDERKFSRLLDIAKSMYASIETEQSIVHPQQTKKRRRNSSGNTSPSASAREKIQCSVTSSKTENVLYVTDTTCSNNSETALQSENSSSKSDSDSRVDAAQCPDVADDSKSGSANSDTESKASSHGIIACQSKVSQVTERNIMTLLARVSHFPETVAHVMNAGTICGLLNYVLLTGNPLPAAGRTLLRLSRSHHGFQRAVLCLFPVQAAWRLEPDWSACRVISAPPSDSGCTHQGIDSDCCIDTESVASSKDVQLCQQEGNCSSENAENVSSDKKSSHCSFALNAEVERCIVRSSKAVRVQKCATSKLCDEILANLSTVAVSGNAEMRAKFLVDMRGVDVLMDVIQTPNSPLFRCAILALSHQARSLQLMSDSAAVGLAECRSPAAAAADAGAVDDLVFVLDDGSQVDALRCVMARSSDVFAAMLSGGFRESSERRVRVRDAASGAFRTMVAWLHGREAEEDASPRAGLDELCDLLPLFHRFQIPDAVRRRIALTPLIAAAFDDDDDDGGGKFVRVYRLLTVYDDCGRLRRDFVVSVFARQMSLRRRCAAVASIMDPEADCDVAEFVSIVTAAFLEAIS